MRKYILFIALMFTINTLKAQSMEWLCRPGEYADIQYMGYDLFKVRNDEGKWGVLSKEGKEVLAAKYENITTFVEERALVLDTTGRKIRAILGPNGEIIKSFDKERIFTTAYAYYKDGMLGYVDDKGLCGYINRDGVVSIKARFLLAAPFQNGIATVKYNDGCYGLIDKSGGSAITDVKWYKFLSSIVDGYLLAVTPSLRGGDLLRIMQLDGNILKTVKTLEKKMYVRLSDDFTYLFSQKAHHYYIDNQWRISGSNYKFELPYKIIDEPTFVTQSKELLSWQESENGVQITYLGKPILEHSFDDVETYERKYAVVRAKDNSIGVLRLNPSAWIEIVDPDHVFVFNHNPLPMDLSANIEEIDASQCIELQVDIKDVNPAQLKCYWNDDGYLRYAPLKESDGVWRLYLPYFRSDTQFGNIVSKELDIAITYDGLEWVHRAVNLSTMHEPGYDVQISANSITNSFGVGNIKIVVRSLNGSSRRRVMVDISGQEPISFEGDKMEINIPVRNIPEGSTKKFTYTVTITEEGCPIVQETDDVHIMYPKQKKEEQKENQKEQIEIEII